MYNIKWILLLLTSPNIHTCTRIIIECDKMPPWELIYISNHTLL